MSQDNAENGDATDQLAGEPLDGETAAPAAAAGPANDLQAQLDEMKKQYLYLRADFENYRKQVIKERSDYMKFGHENVIKEFLGVLDNLERAAAIDLTAESAANYKSGVDMIVSQFKKSMERFQVEEVPCEGHPFDPMVHEALSSEANPDVANGAITRVFKKAYKLNGKLIRPAQVVVNTLPAQKDS